ncbi:MAG: phosphatase PAP2 family protein [Gemmatimonadetes bacterium]|nr:phosphatase PAP2 family protein [Gemmatimonadota bacterium]
MRAVDLLTIAYLALSLAALAGPHRPARWPLLLLTHLGLIAAIWAVGRVPTKPVGSTFAKVLRVVRSWYPLLIVPYLYTELPLLNQSLASGYYDAAIVALEQTVFRTQPAQRLAGALPWPALSEILHAGYLSYYLLIYVPPLVLYAQGRRHAYARALFYEMLTFYACYLVFIVFPVQGPFHLWTAPPGVPDGPVRALTLRILEAGSSRGAAFPSSHVAVALMQTLVGFRWLPRLAPVLALLTVALGVGAVYGGFHYATDVILGAAAAFALVPVARVLHRRLARWNARCAARRKRFAVTERQV